MHRPRPLLEPATYDVGVSHVQPHDMIIVRNLTLLLQGLAAIPTLAHALSGSRSPLLFTVCEMLCRPLLTALRNDIRALIDEGALYSGGTAEQQHLCASAVKPGVNLCLIWRGRA